MGILRCLKSQDAKISYISIKQTLKSRYTSCMNLNSHQTNNFLMVLKDLIENKCNKEPNIGY